MAKSTPIVNNFNGGEVNSKIDARVDIQKYYTACRTLENFIPLVEGGAMRSPGTYFVVATKDSGSKASRLIGFHFSTIQAYILEVGDLYIRFYKDNGQIVIDQSMNNFDASAAYFAGEYCKVGKSVDISFAGSKHLYVMAPFGRANSGTVKVAASTNGADTLSVTEAGDTITIAVANGTSSKNAANLVQVALRALGTCNGVDVSDWVVCENAAYAAARPITASLAATLLSGGESLHQCTTEVFTSTTNMSYYPPAEATFWNVVTQADPVEIVTPYLEADLSGLKFFGSADIMWITHPSYPTKKLTRTSHIQWELSNHIAKVGDAMVVTGITQANPAVITCTTVPATLVAGDTVYISSVVGMREVNNQFFTVGTVVTGAGGTFQLAGIDSTAYTAYSSGGSAQETMFGTEDNCPSCGTFFEQRLVLAATNNLPQTIGASKSADYDDFNTGAYDADAIVYTLVSDRVDRIRWIIGQDYIMIGTVGGFWRFGATTTSEPLTPSNVNAKKHGTFGSADLDAEVLADAILWVSRSGIQVRRMAYSFENDKYIAQDMTKIAKHIARATSAALSGISDMDFQSEPVPILWSTRKDGQLLGMTYENEEQVYAWFRIVTDGYFESVAVISEDDSEDQVWVITKRIINGSTVRYIEYFKPHEFYSSLEDCFFVHSGLTWEGQPAATVTAISKAATCIATLAAGHGITAGDKLKFRFTGTWLDTHIVTAHAVNVNDITIYNEGDTAAIDSTAFTTYTYPASAVVTGYTGAAQNIVNIEQSNPVRIFLPDHGLEAATLIRIADVSGMTEINGDHTIASVTQDTITITLDATAYGEYTSGGTVTPGSSTTQNGTCEEVKKAFTTGLTHLEGETLDILVDGAVHPRETVTAGNLTLDYYGNKIHLGLPYTSTLEPMKIHTAGQLGTIRGKKQKITKLTACFHETRGGKAGPDTDNLKSIPFGTGGQPELFTGDVDFTIDSDWGNEATIAIVQDQPLPMTVLAIVPHLNVEES